MKQKLALLPQPQRVTFGEGVYTVKACLCFAADRDVATDAENFLSKILGSATTRSAEHADVRFVKDLSLKKEGYELSIQPNHIELKFADACGMFYALITLKQIVIQYGNDIPCLEIEDFPDLEVRGVMLDISRDKVPKLSSLYQLVDKLAMLKFNHFELYIEGFSFAYPSFANLWRGETPITGEEIKALDAYCKERFIDLVPNQNGLGHMAAWLATDEYRDLAESNKGVNFFGMEMPPSTLNPTDERSLALVRQMTSDLLPNFSSKYFNVNLDEPFELGAEKNKMLAEEIGKGQLYIDYVKKIYKMVNDEGKKMLMWGDIINKHPEIIPQIPKDVTVLQWGYESNSPFDKYGNDLSNAGLDFYMCPGTSSWTSLAGRTDNMLKNITAAAESAKKYGAKGLLVTDWGDSGHLQYIPVSYAGFAFSAALAWNTASKDELDLAEYLDLYIYQDKMSQMGRFSLDLGRYNQFEDFPMMNMTLTNFGLMVGLMPKAQLDMIFEGFGSFFQQFLEEDQAEAMLEFQAELANRKPYDYNGLCAYLKTLQSKLHSHVMECEGAQLINDSYENAIRMIQLGADLRNYIEQEGSLDVETKKAVLGKMRKDLQTLVNEHKRIWLIENKEGGLDRSLGAFARLEGQLNQAIKGL